ncbi:multisubunit Na+/H+ antiporter MnhC subunit [Cryobacterium mesophilum]|uniref:Na(+)/H(+) antiporter subunit C n=1 Tax=Terrimesophilobacter mesophilus TaxID=433647 RepID=A0A4R8V8E3_9MICO|nr:Na(+)/H(+) antiporter subunit C [Terrimesophilobacter mesophilus]MBB5632595.1 multisubunit Na+/H+ antiporter MnhC subunit [Terrimesophilobacter mesophilus]TFB79411.1 Na(+)/H(+) antiporter subunit C [Terrimesophilobacter mesophilus]
MSVSLVLVAVMAVLYSCGVYLLLERSMTRVLLGFLLVGNATNLLILVVSGRAGAAPFYGESDPLADPLPQAFVLTSIVITFGVSAFLMALIYRSWRLAHADVVEDDTEDVAVGRRDVSVAAEPEIASDDTEFGTRATAAVSTAVDLAEQERLEEAERLEMLHRFEEQLRREVEPLDTASLDAEPLDAERLDPDHTESTDGDRP